MIQLTFTLEPVYPIYSLDALEHEEFLFNFLLFTHSAFTTLVAASADLTSGFLQSDHPPFLSNTISITYKTKNNANSSRLKKSSHNLSLSMDGPRTRSQEILWGCR
ncbi:hypothetical protein BpHYR1_012528 [Brachionus plicatilis]|uniref:Uncharacterized protein n=1 Tax=Brachionus plicatilis TaxID=10195 RepID=A0A3M7SCE9_BRAPC|nr:hypothetical protein BpHYR1_012528 [Brachionus plicatilis]